MLRKLPLALLLLLGVSLAQAESYHYEVQVEGMVCAYCAYNVTQRFNALPGVVPHSVEVDLKAQRVNFQSQTTLAKPVIENALGDTGFTVKSIRQHTAREQQALSLPSVKLASVSFPVKVLGSELSTQLLEALGETAAQQQGRFTVQAPRARETAILKSLLAGRRRVIPVDFKDDMNNTVTVTLWVK